MMGPSVSAMMRFVATTSSSIDVSGICTAMTDKSLACSREVTLFQLDPSAQAPCTSTMVAVDFDMPASSVLSAERPLLAPAGRIARLGTRGSGLPFWRWTGLRSVPAERPFREANLDAVRRMRPQDLHHTFVSRSTCPILLQLEDILERRDRDRTRLNGSVHGAIVRLQRNVATGVGGDVDLETLFQEVERPKQHAGFRPQTRDDDLLARGFVDGVAKILIEPCIHRGAVDDCVLGKQFCDFRHEQARKRVGLDRRNNGRDAEQLGRLRQDLNIVESDDPVMRLNALVHRGLVVDERNRMILRAKHIEVRHRMVL